MDEGEPEEQPDGDGREPEEIESLVDLTRQLREAGAGEAVKLREVLDRFDERSYGPLLLIPSVLAWSPIGMIPGVSIATGALIFAVAVQMALGRPQPWLPKRALEFEFPRAKMERASRVLEPWARRIDRLIHPRWPLIVDPPALYVTAGLCMLLAMSMYPLALLPFAVAVPALCLTMMALGITFRDGLLVAIGWGGILAVGYLLRIALS